VILRKHSEHRSGIIERRVAMSCFVVEIDKDEDMKDYSSYFSEKIWEITEEQYCKKFELRINSEICIIFKKKDKPCNL
jgi:uncharacterized protein Veg